MHFASSSHGSLPAALGLAALGLLSLAAAPVHAQTQDLFVSNQIGSTISRFAGTGPGTFSTTATTLADPNGTLNGPRGLAFDAKGDLFAANVSGNTITEFAAGATPGTLVAGTTVADSTSGLNQPVGLAFDTRGNLFAANLSNNTITEFAAGATPGTFGATSTLSDPNGTLNKPEGLAFDAKGDLFAANFNGSNNIIEFAFNAASGTFGAGTIFASGLRSTVGLAFDARGDLFAANVGSSNSTTNGSITEFAFNPAGNGGAGSFGAPTTFASGLSRPSFLAFGPSVSAPVPEASTTVSLGLLLALGMGGLVVTARKKRRA